MLNVGDPAPDFEIPLPGGGTTRLSELVAPGPLVVFFYPADFTPICTREACMVRDVHDELLGAGVRVVGVSPQSRESHERFASKYSLRFPLVADPGRDIFRAYGALGPFGIGVRRVTFLVGPDGRIGGRVVADLRVARHREFIRGVIGRA